jgi:hypothetical protein
LVYTICYAELDGVLQFFATAPDLIPDKKIGFSYARQTICGEFEGNALVQIKDVDHANHFYGDIHA